MPKQSKPVRKRQMKRAYRLLWQCRMRRWNRQWKMFVKLNKYPISPLKMGRMNGRCYLGFDMGHVFFDEIDSKEAEKYAEVFLRNASSRPGSDTERNASCTSIR